MDQENRPAEHPYTPAAFPEEKARDGYPLPVLMYHSILPDTRYAGTYVLPPAVLERDLQVLGARGYETVTVVDLLNYVDYGDPLPEKPVMLTFDDGYYNNCVYLLPLLEKYDMRAVLSPVGQFADTYTENGEHSVYYAMAGWEELRALAESGRIELQNHSYALHALSPRKGAARLPGEDPTAYQRMLTEDLSRMQQALRDRCGVQALAFAYPFGAADPAADEVLRALGFRCSFSCEERISTITRDPESLWLLGRWNRPYGVETEDFLAKLQMN